MSVVELHALNARELQRAERRHRWYLFGSGLPALLLVLLTFVLPIGWLFWLSLFDANGQLTIENYTRLLEPIYVLTFVQTFKISIIVTIACVLIGYPYAYFMIRARAGSPTWPWGCFWCRCGHHCWCVPTRG